MHLRAHPRHQNLRHRQRQRLQQRLQHHLPPNLRQLQASILVDFFVSDITH